MAPDVALFFQGRQGGANAIGRIDVELVHDLADRGWRATTADDGGDKVENFLLAIGQFFGHGLVFSNIFRVRVPVQAAGLARRRYLHSYLLHIRSFVKTQQQRQVLASACFFGSLWARLANQRPVGQEWGCLLTKSTLLYTVTRN